MLVSCNRPLPKHIPTYIPIFGILLSLLVTFQTATAGDEFTIARVKYDGGGDWYSNPSSLPNLLRFIREHTDVKTTEKEAVVELSDPRLFNYPYLYLNGHGNINFSEREVQTLRRYFEAGGFLHADDNYGMDKSFRREIMKALPGAKFVDLPYDHPVYHSYYDFPNGAPKIHEHDGKPAQGFGLFLDGRLVVYYTYQCDLGDGWEDPEVHHDPEELRQAALKMGTNLVIWRLRGGQ